MPGGRVSRYDWDDKKEICYKLFVEERKSPREIVEGGFIFLSLSHSSFLFHSFYVCWAC